MPSRRFVNDFTAYATLPYRRVISIPTCVFLDSSSAGFEPLPDREIVLQLTTLKELTSLLRTDQFLDDAMAVGTDTIAPSRNDISVTHLKRVRASCSVLIRCAPHFFHVMHMRTRTMHACGCYNVNSLRPCGSPYIKPRFLWDVKCYPETVERARDQTICNIYNHVHCSLLRSTTTIPNPRDVLDASPTHKVAVSTENNTRGTFVELDPIAGSGVSWLSSVVHVKTAEVKQHCQKVRLELPTSNRKPSDPIVAGIPTLRDLLNPDTVDEQPIDEEALFNNPDPYGIKDCEAEEDKEDESDIAAPPLVIRHADVLNLEIEVYIDLSSSKLTQRFAPDQGSPEPVVVDAAKKPVKNTKTKWVEEDAEWDAEAW
ncbi:hypothetical protein DFH09DRAFT_1271318 [Mycena vulgaris]|nr:hypothetical protein DFH09DRAFT_1271318 [Mycena vulgaris]